LLLLLLLLPATAALFVCREGTSSCVGCTDKTSEQLSRRTDRIWSVAVPSENLLLFVCFSVAVCRRRRGRATAAARKAAGRRCREEKKNHVVSADTYPTVYCTVAARFRAKSRANESSRKIRTRRENLLSCLPTSTTGCIAGWLHWLAGRGRQQRYCTACTRPAVRSFVRSFVRILTAHSRKADGRRKTTATTTTAAAAIAAADDERRCRVRLSSTAAAVVVVCAVPFSGTRRRTRASRPISTGTTATT